MIDNKFDYLKLKTKIIEDIESIKKPGINDEHHIYNEDTYKYLYCMPARHNRAAEYKEFNKNTQEYVDDTIEKIEQIKEICLVKDIIDIYNGKYKNYEDYINHVTSKGNKFIYDGQNVILVIRRSTFNYLFCKRNLKTQRENILK